MKEKLLQVLKRECPAVDFFASEHLADEGVIDSVTLISIVSALSEAFSITIPYQEITAANFNSVDAITALIERLAGERTAVVPVVEKLFENAKRWPDRLAIIFENEEVTYGRLRQAVIRLASWWKAHGMIAGDRVVVQAYHGKWFVASCFAAHLCGAVFIPVEKGITPASLDHIVTWTEARFTVGQIRQTDTVHLDYREMEKILQDVQEQPWSFPEPDAVANIMLTSGTTGPQKGALLSHRNLACNCLGRLHEMDIPPNDIGITLMPLDHVGSMRMWQTAIYNGSTYILLDGILKLPLLFEFIERYHVTSLYISPSLAASMQMLTRDKLHEYAGQIEYVHVGTSLMQEQQREFLLHMLPESRLFNAYGSTENGNMATIRFDREKKSINCVGRPWEEVEVRVLDDTLHEVPRGKIGRLAFRSDMNCKGYWKNDELTKSVYHNGMFMSNDAGYLDADGYLYVLGRMDDVIDVGGLKLLPSEIEEETSRIEGVADCICFDVPHPITGRAPKLLIKQTQGAELTVQAVRTRLAEKLDNYKLPVSIEFVRQIKQTPNGKPDRKYYRENN